MAMACKLTWHSGIHARFYWAVRNDAPYVNNVVTVVRMLDGLYRARVTSQQKAYRDFADLEDAKQWGELMFNLMGGN